MTEIQGNDINSGKTIYPFLPPSPPKSSLPHHYVIGVYLEDENEVPWIPTTEQGENVPRAYFPLQKFIFGNHLKQLGYVVFQTGSDAQQVQQIKQEYPPMMQGGKLPTPQVGYFHSQSTLSPGEEAYCRCVLHVGAKNPPDCDRQRLYFQTVNGKKCYNPFAVCTSSVGAHSECTQSYNFQGIPDDELIAYSNVRRLPISDPYDRNTQLSIIASQYVCPKFPNHPICSQYGLRNNNPPFKNMFFSSQL